VSSVPEAAARSTAPRRQRIHAYLVSRVQTYIPRYIMYIIGILCMYIGILKEIFVEINIMDDFLRSVLMYLTESFMRLLANWF
jgi:hypothetical protein